MEKNKRYTNRKRLYSGHYSDVYSAIDSAIDTTDSTTDASVCLKIVDCDVRMKPHDIRHEIGLLKRLDHPGILAWKDDFIWNDDIVLVTPLYQYDLNGLLDKHTTRAMRHNLEDPSKSKVVVKNTLPEASIEKIVVGLAQALAYLHDQGIIHRDVKPSNIYFNQSVAHPVLGDFGISYDDQSPEPAHAKYTDVGTGIYKAPELCLGVVDYGPEIDGWALGVVMTLLYLRTLESVLEPEEGDEVVINDLYLIHAIFQNFGTPSLDSSSELYWPEMADDRYYFNKLQFQPQDRRHLQTLVPRCTKPLVRQTFDKLMTYDRWRRISMKQLAQEMAGAPV
ncbi:kinase-like protein [Suhomyces tanzawaensis NRRL Y-17324]|uniref:Kinase-like protein n=1 Tax=Suhomyces tanzawaensis NRRL Y-17324 TaxID=984487 RepID=A0A1E4SJW4_9ASCO|nr:kinase-like protein [Suhomyces tanzawaensis NRRL Y-17324]ODV79794.1 kinase-like protein [Suhomyces tanzawaensis NRRL Y-17324]